LDVLTRRVHLQQTAITNTSRPFLC